MSGESIHSDGKTKDPEILGDILVQDTLYQELLPSGSQSYGQKE
jgi:hypothetical protein|tara:strand:- start:546 stop:677 length:132 start_codon:yes stop_codon:yes gene_type:complete